ncbi:MAG: BON domain-containing protein [Pseudomonadales bacterium]
MARSTRAVLGAMLLLLCGSVFSGCAGYSRDPTQRTTGAVLDDQFIEMQVKRDIRKSDDGFRSAHLVVVSYNGVVLLAGQVENERLRAQAEDVARQMRAVRRVHNELTIGGPISLPTRTADSWLTAKVKTQLLADDEVVAGHVKVVTENGIVYLMGMITRAEADRATEVARSVFGVQKIVKVFEYL